MINELLSISLLVDEKVVVETLSRMGIPDIQHKKLYQTCHLFKQFDCLYLAHFKQLFKFATTKNGTPGFRKCISRRFNTQRCDCSTFTKLEVN